jgi:hypothetical protein
VIDTTSGDSYENEEFLSGWESKLLHLAACSLFIAIVMLGSWCRGRGSGLQLRTNPHHGIWNHVGDDDYAALSELQVVDGYGNIDKSCGRTPERWLRR